MLINPCLPTQRIVHRGHRRHVARSRALVTIFIPALGFGPVAPVGTEAFAQSNAITESGNQEVLRQQQRDQQRREQQQRQPDLRLPEIQLGDGTTEQKPALADGRLPIDESPCFAIHTLSLEGEQKLLRKFGHWEKEE